MSKRNRFFSIQSYGRRSDAIAILSYGTHGTFSEIQDVLYDTRSDMPNGSNATLCSRVRDRTSLIPMRGIEAPGDPRFTFENPRNSCRFIHCLHERFFSRAPLLANLVNVRVQARGGVYAAREIP